MSSKLGQAQSAGGIRIYSGIVELSNEERGWWLKINLACERWLRARGLWVDADEFYGRLGRREEL